ncbi:MAG: pseudaminic acid cytidylyltransferase [Desulfobulbaceae bacterium]
MKTVAIIPARGGSKRIPRKNIRPFAGKPIIGYSIETAKASGLFDRIIVSTDDREIATVAGSFGAEAPFLRPAELADDFAGTAAVVKHCLQWLIEHGDPAQYACCIYATAPFVQVEYLRQGFEHLIASGKSYAFSVTSFPFPIQRAVRINQEGYTEAIWPENTMTRSQDLEEAYHDAGQFYWGTVQAFLSDELIFSPKSVPVVLPRYLVQDIDTPEDWLRAELMYAAMHNNSEVAR